MKYDDLIVLIPSHSLEDFPTELDEEPAEGLLNAFAVLWHPALLASARVLPSWHRADAPPDLLTNRLIIVPTACQGWLPHGWVERARGDGAVVVAGEHKREAMLRAALESLDALGSHQPADGLPEAGHDAQVAGEVAGDFFALGLCSLQLELLTRYMHHFSNLDEVYLQREAVAAAEAALAGDAAAARSHLKACFEVLLEARERFYPVECFVMDLCLVIPRLADEHLIAALAGRSGCGRKGTGTLVDSALAGLADEGREPVPFLSHARNGTPSDALAGPTPVNLVATASDLREIDREHPEITAALRAAWNAGTADVCGGDLREAPLPLLPLASVVWEFAEGRRVFGELFGPERSRSAEPVPAVPAKTGTGTADDVAEPGVSGRSGEPVPVLARRAPTTWGRRRYGLSVALPQILHRFGFHSALHLVMDDGLYPDAEQSKIRWEGTDGTVIDAISRIPLAADAATSYLRFARRLSESMEQDHVAALLFARWPEIKSPFFEDLRRMQAYAPVLGRFVTLDEFFRHSDDPGRLSSYQAREYLTPFLIQSVARRELNPISRYADHFQRRLRFDSARWCAATADVLSGRGVSEEPLAAVERQVEEAGAEGDDETVRAATEALDEFVPSAARKLAGVVLHGAGGQRGLLVLNPLSFPRTASVELPVGFESPPPGGDVKAVQLDERRRLATVQLPASGYAWIPSGGSTPAAAPVRDAGRRAAPLAEELVLRNEFFEVFLNEATGGIARIKGYGRSPNRLSQQLAFRFPEERTVRLDEDEGENAESVRTWYSEMRCRSMEIVCSGPAMGEIVTTGALVDPEDRVEIAGYRQTVRVWRGRPVVEIEIELELHRPPEGNPWLNYYAARFAWNDPAAALTRSVHEGAQPAGGERIESPHYLEIATEDQRTTILPCGLPFHRKTGGRMLDTILVVEGESRRRFRFVVAVDEEFPMQAALDAMSPPLVVAAETGPPQPGASGWFFHLDSRGVQLVRVMDLASAAEVAGWSTARADGDATYGFAVRLLETEGRQRQVRLRCVRTPVAARQRDFTGRPLAELAIQGDAVRIDIGPYELTDVELLFGAHSYARMPLTTDPCTSVRR
ncbi:MAG TPA: hypothetical protein VML55_14605 [Planctomycetaceae bacterium]|nr:hypothetical protein [Planctomycetaceae bacterium]